ncbi:hypothetical protein ACK3SF_05010 [Candidatus Nanosalina sp. VS9-1]|uniref:hypothetical protein n=1 Tax=Candidatus Nanosalina sp. VS9-1 TaxID=3388566 RepID=UPI0039E12353
MNIVFDIKRALEMIFIGLMAGTASFLLLPLVAARLMPWSVAAFTATVITVPLTWYFLNVPEGSIPLDKYMDARGWTGLLIDILLVLVSAMTPATVIMYYLLSQGLILPVPVASAAAIGVYTGYAGFLFRNRALYENEGLDIEL